MKKTDIESFLRENKPQVKDNPTFLLEVQQKMRSVEGVKSEVERQRRYGRYALIIALLTGLVTGTICAAIMYFYSIESEAIGGNLIATIKAFIEPWKHHILLFVTVCAIALGMIFSTGKGNSIFYLKR